MGRSLLAFRTQDTGDEPQQDGQSGWIDSMFVPQYYRYESKLEKVYRLWLARGDGNTAVVAKHW